MESLSFHKMIFHMIGLLVTRTNPAFHMGSVYTATAEDCADSWLHFANPPIVVLMYTLDFLVHFDMDW